MQGERSHQTTPAASGGRRLMKDDESIRTGYNMQVTRSTEAQLNQTKSKVWAEGKQKPRDTSNTEQNH